MGFQLCRPDPLVLAAPHPLMQFQLRRQVIMLVNQPRRSDIRESQYLQHGIDNTVRVVSYSPADHLLHCFPSLQPVAGQNDGKDLDPHQPRPFFRSHPLFSPGDHIALPVGRQPA